MDQAPITSGDQPVARVLLKHFRSSITMGVTPRGRMRLVTSTLITNIGELITNAADPGSGGPGGAVRSVAVPGLAGDPALGTASPEPVTGSLAAAVAASVDLAGAAIVIEDDRVAWVGLAGHAP